MAGPTGATAAEATSAVERVEGPREALIKQLNSAEARTFRFRVNKRFILIQSGRLYSATVK